MIGRKKITLDIFPSDWQERVLNLYKKGASDVEIRCLLSDIRKDSKEFISNELFYRLLEEDESFSQTIKKGREICRTWWEKKGRTNLKNRDFNFTGWYMNMKNRFKDDWNADNKQEIKHSGSISAETLAEQKEAYEKEIKQHASLLEVSKNKIDSYV